MARHESEMHRQRRELLDFVRNVAGFDDRWLANAEPRLLRATLLEFRTQARKLVNPSCDVGLFGDNRQMDLADRKDC